MLKFLCAQAVNGRLWIPLAMVACVAPMWAADVHQLPEYVFTLAPQYEPDAWIRGGERFPAGAALYLAAGHERHRIAPDVSFSADAFVSYDGSRLLFSGKRTLDEPWQVWEALFSGGAARQITQGDTDCTRPLYLPDGRVVYTRRAGLESMLEVAQSDGGMVERLTFAPGLYLTDDVLKDGRIFIRGCEPAIHRRKTGTIHCLPGWVWRRVAAVRPRT